MKNISSRAILVLVTLLITSAIPAKASIDAPRAFVVEGGVYPYQLNVLWVNPNSTNLDHINIYLSTQPLTEFGIVSTITGTQAQPNQKGEYLLTNLIDQRGTTNYYYVYLTAVDKSGTESAPTTTLKRQTGSSQDLTATEPVTGLVADTISATSLRLTWTNPTASDLYQTKIYRSTTTPVTRNDINLIASQVILPSSTGVFIDTGLTPTTTYYYLVHTLDVADNFSEPATTSATTLSAPITPPTPPVITPTPDNTTPPSIMPNPANFDFRAQWVAQSGSLSADKKSHLITAHAGETLQLSLTLKNIGTSTWFADTSDNANEIKIGTWRKQDRVSVFQSNSWLSSNRLVRLTSDTANGNVATFLWTLTIPANTKASSYREYFRPVAEYCKWFGPTGIFWDIVVS